jgi:hypothetical protein
MHVTEASQAEVFNLTEAWFAFLSGWRWDWFCTFTFRVNVQPEAADRYFGAWMNTLNRRLYGRRWSSRTPGAWYACATERTKRGRIHFHALIGAPELAALSRLEHMRAWTNLGCCPRIRRCDCSPKRGPGIARIEAPHDFQAAAVRAYCSKYVAKGGEVNLGGAVALVRRTRQEALSFDGSEPGRVALSASPPLLYEQPAPFMTR